MFLVKRLQNSPVKTLASLKQYDYNTPKNSIDSTKIFEVHSKKQTLDFDRSVKQSKFTNDIENSRQKCKNKKTPMTRVPYKCKSCSKMFNLFLEFKNHLLIHKKIFLDTRDKSSCIKPASGLNVIGNIVNEPVVDSIEEEKIQSNCVEETTDVKGVALLKCSKCALRFDDVLELRRHMKTHKVNLPYVCHKCGKLFNRSGSFSYHIHHVHHGIKNHKCSVCSRSFSQKLFLADHMRIHTGERPFICDLCGKRFKTSSSLRSHKRSHTDNYPFSCSLCDRKFRTRQHCDNHFLIHTGEKKFVCDVCCKKFTRENELKQHKLIHSNDYPYSCTVCSLSFKVKRYLRNHMKTKHDICMNVSDEK